MANRPDRIDSGFRPMPDCSICGDARDVFELTGGCFACSYCEVDLDSDGNPLPPLQSESTTQSPSATSTLDFLLPVFLGLLTPLKTLLNDLVAERDSRKFSLSKSATVDCFSTITKISDDGTVSSEIDIAILAGDCPYDEIVASLDSDGDISLMHPIRGFLGWLPTPASFRLIDWVPSVAHVTVVWECDLL